MSSWPRHPIASRGAAATVVPALTIAQLFPLMPDGTRVIGRPLSVDAAYNFDCLPSQSTLVAGSRALQAVTIQSWRQRPILGELCAEHDHIAILAEPRFGSMQGADVGRVTRFDQRNS
jgi:hypothetical protein